MCALEQLPQPPRTCCNLPRSGYGEIMNSSDRAMGVGKRSSPLREAITLEWSASSETIAVIIPCYNEEITIAEVIARFRDQLPDAEIYVCDNNSSDRTVERATQAGAKVFHEKRQGKGYAVQ